MSEILYIVIPTYNEEENIQSVIEDWYPMLKACGAGSKMVIADGGSKDHTLDILYKMKKKYPDLEILSRPGTDHGTKVSLLYRYAVACGADWIFQTDSDGQTVAAEFRRFWRIRGEYDAIMGDRKSRGDGFGRKCVENVLRLYILFFFGVWLPDANAPFRLMRSKTVSKYMYFIPENFNLPNAIFAACFSRFRERVIYKEITFRPRQGGKNHMNLKRIIKIGMDSIRNFAVIRKNMQEYEKKVKQRRR